MGGFDKILLDLKTKQLGNTDACGVWLEINSSYQSHPVVEILRMSHKNTYFAFFGNCNGMLNFLQSVLRFSALIPNFSLQFLWRMLSVAISDESVESFSVIGIHYRKSKIFVEYTNEMPLYTFIKLLF